MKENRNASAFLQGGGEMGELIRSIDWAATPLNDPESWPYCLKTAVAIMLSSPFPMYIAWGTEYTQLYNDAYRPILGKDKHPQAMGISTHETFHEIFHLVGPMFDGVMAGKPVFFPDFQYVLERNGYPEECYFDFSYSPIRDENGAIDGVLVICMETTEKVFARRHLEENNERLRLAVQSESNARQQIEAMNKRMAVQNDELAAINKELAETEKTLQQIVKELAASDARFRFLIQGAPVAISALTGRELIIESANDKMLTIWGKTTAIIGKPLAVALPELVGQPFLKLLDDVFTSGQPFYGFESKAYLEHDGQLQEIYFDFIYQPLKEGEKTNTILVVAVDVTEKVVAKKELERAYEQARLSKHAALLGTFDMDLEKGTMEWDERCRTLFGISHHDMVTYDKDFVTGLHQDDRERVLKVIDNVMSKSISNGDYDVEYRTVGVEDQRVRWVRAKGKAYFDDEDKPVRFIGSVLDITEQKTEQIRLKESAEMQARLAARLEVINQIIQTVSAELDLNKILQKITDATTELTGANFGAFFYNKIDDKGESYMLYTLSGAPREAFEKFGMPRNTAVFHPTFSGEGVVRVDDITKDPRYGKSAPHFGMPKGHLPVVSYLAVPVTSRSGEVIGGLFFGHPKPGRFTKEHEALVTSIAAQSAIGIDNAKLYEEVKRLNEKKDEFIGLASHELKTPLTSISGYLQILSRLIPDEPSQRFLDKTRLQVAKLATLVNDLLDVSKIEAGQLQLAMEEFDIMKTLRDAIELIGHSNNKYQIILESSVESCNVYADPQRVEQVLINLLSNAIKYSPGTDKVILSLYCTREDVRVGVKDFGLGIPPDKLTHIFQRFYRVQDNAPYISGLGIGLYLSKEIITRHQGNLWAESKVGEGSTFWFTLPAIDN